MSVGRKNKPDNERTTITVLRTTRDGINKCKLVEDEPLDSVLNRLIKFYREYKAKEKIITIPDEKVLEDVIERLIKKYKEYEAAEQATVEIPE